MGKIKPLEKLDIVMSVFNQEKLIERVLYGILSNTTTPFNLILIFDGCNDKTETRAKKYIKRVRAKHLRNIITRTTNNIYETKANNVGFRLAKEEFMITLQDDMIIKEKSWEKRLTYPLRKFNYVLAVTSRGAHDIEEINSNAEKYTNMASRELGTLDRNTFAIRDIINRGPIAFRMEYLRKLNYLNENYAPCNLDEADLSLRAWRLYKWNVGAFWIDYYSPLEFGKSRDKDSTMPIWESNKKNCAQLSADHEEYLKSKIKHSKNITIDDKEIDLPANKGLGLFWLYYPIRMNTKLIRKKIYNIKTIFKKTIKQKLVKFNLVTREDIENIGIKKIIRNRLRIKGK